MTPRPLILAAALITALPLAACDAPPADPQAKAAAERLDQARAHAATDLEALAKSRCADQPAIDRLAALADDVAVRHPLAEPTAELLRSLMDSACPALQSRVVIAARALRPAAESRTPSADLLAILRAGLSSPDPAVRTSTALTIHELRLSPRGTDLADRLKALADSDPDPKVRATAAWTAQRLAQAP
jgi:hypothetical protein